MASDRQIRALWSALLASGVQQPRAWNPDLALEVWRLGLHALTDDDLVSWLQRWASATPTDDRDRERRRWWPIPADIVADCRPAPSKADVASTADADLVYLRDRWTLGAGEVYTDEAEAIARMLPIAGQIDRARVTRTTTRTEVTTRDGRTVSAWAESRSYGPPTAEDVARHERIREVIARMGGLRAVARALRSTDDGAMAGLGFSFRAAAGAVSAQQLRALDRPQLTDADARRVQTEIARRLAVRGGGA